MQDSTSVIDIIVLSFDKTTGKVSFGLNLYFSLLLLLLLLIGILFWYWRRRQREKYAIKDTEFVLDLGFATTKFRVQRNTENLRIANRIYTELVTRKAALFFEEDKDVIKEVYDSWYNLFGIIRDEIKEVPGEYLIDHDPTNALIGLSIRILNEGLRPHLTEHQAKFRRWYARAIEQEENMGKSPQEIQRQYPEYEDLKASLFEVNKILINFSEELQRLIRGEEE